ncbi:hypothetical protein EYF80_021910 [Liparis tanakae]|uniref:Uncharacterized protein n=1 Tax=Liparis tanakae TaxID=230148 RepID=A0A4Z2HQT6_9TELE|nr:hypothetical protein EYF80_021910 [Liparis tanakae]
MRKLCRTHLQPQITYEETNEPSVSSSRMETSVHVVHTETPDKSFPASASDWYGPKVQRGVQRVLDSESAALVGGESRLKLNRALALSVSKGTQLGSNRVVRLGFVGGMVWVVSTTATILPSGKHTFYNGKGAFMDQSVHHGQRLGVHNRHFHSRDQTPQRQILHGERKVTTGNVYSCDVMECKEAAHLHQVPVQLASPEEELPLQLAVGPVVQQHQQAALGALPLQLGGPRRCAMRNRQGVDLQPRRLV